MVQEGGIGAINSSEEAAQTITTLSGEGKPEYVLNN